MKKFSLSLALAAASLMVMSAAMAGPAKTGTTSKGAVLTDARA